MILPVLPTTPFLLLAAACYIRGSPRIYQRLISNRIFGEFIGNYMKGKGIKRRQKGIAIFSMWLMISITIIFFLDDSLLRFLLLVIAGVVSLHTLNLPTFHD